MFNKTASFLTIFLLFVTAVYAQIKIPEQLDFTVYYHLGPVWIKGGKLTLKTDRGPYKNDTLIKLTGTGVSAKRWSWIFDIKEEYESWCINKDFWTLKSKKYAYENGFEVNNSYDFDYNNNIVSIKTKTSGKPETNFTMYFEPPLYDAQSAVNYLRHMDYGNFQSGDTISLNILLDGEFEKMNIVIYKNQNLKDKAGNVYKTLLFTALVPKNTLFSSEEAVKVWTTDDEKRIPIKIKADLFVGSIEAINDSLNFKKPE